MRPCRRKCSRVFKAKTELGVDLLLDTHVLLRALSAPERLSEAARAAIMDPRNRVCVSAASAWEIAIKVALGKLQVPPDVAVWLPRELDANRFESLAIDLRHALALERLPLHHTDPFDRMLVAQAMIEALVVVTADKQIEAYKLPTLRC